MTGGPLERVHVLTPYGTLGGISRRYVGCSFMTMDDVGLSG
jgi:hypothetical protein